MSTENTTPVEPTVTEDLDTFSAELFGQSKADPEPASSEVDEVSDEESDASTTETQTNDETDTLDTEETDNTEEDEDSNEEPQPKQPKNRTQERIKELNAKYREEERQRKALETRLAELESKLTPTENKPTETSSEVAGPAPDDLNEDGSEKYPLGEFDPQYIRDLTKFTLQQEREALKAEEAKSKEQEKYEAEREALTQSWTEKLGPAQERYPDFQEKGEELYETFAGIDQSYGEYLSATLMSMDYGPDVLYYLANNLDEANKIVASGPTKATIALGRLEAKFAEAEAEKQKARPKVSNAPAPPTTLRGSTAVMPEVPDDTEDLDAFSKKLFKGKKK